MEHGLQTSSMTAGVIVCGLDFRSVQPVPSTTLLIAQRQCTQTSAGATRTNRYDLAGRLERVTRNGAEIADYDYDSNSNREQATYSGDLATALTQCAAAAGPITTDIDGQTD